MELSLTKANVLHALSHAKNVTMPLLALHALKDSTSSMENAQINALISKQCTMEYVFLAKMLDAKNVQPLILLLA